MLDVLRQKKCRIVNTAERETVERQHVLPGYNNIMSHLAGVFGDSCLATLLCRGMSVKTSSSMLAKSGFCFTQTLQFHQYRTTESSKQH